MILKLANYFLTNYSVPRLHLYQELEHCALLSQALSQICTGNTLSYLWEKNERWGNSTERPPASEQEQMRKWPATLLGLAFWKSLLGQVKSRREWDQMLSRQWNWHIDLNINGNTAALILPLWFRHFLGQILALISLRIFSSLAGVF